MKQSLNRFIYIRVAFSLLCNLLLSYLLFMLCRLVFLWVNHSYYTGLTIAELFSIFKGGLVFDTSAIVYVNSFYILLMLLPLHYKEKKLYQQVAKWIFILTNSLALVMNLMDTVYFQYTNRRTTASVFSEFSREGNIGGIIGVELLHHWYLTLLAVCLIVGLYKFYRMPFGKVSRRTRLPLYYTTQVVCLAAAVPFCIFGMRGGIGAAVRPITVSNANQYVNRPIETALVLNTPFSVIRTIGKKPFTVPSYFKDEQAMAQVYTPVHTPADSVHFRPLNVVVFIMESFGKEYVGALNKELDGGTYKGYTPFLDSLIAESFTTEYSFANGRKSIDGMPSVLSGIPMFVEPFFLTPASMNKVSGIAGELRKKGYYSAFFHGAENGSMGFEAFSRATGFQDYYGRTEYNNDADFDGRWAIWDEEFFQFFDAKLSTFRQPFVAALFSASSHHPFVVPQRYEGKFPKGTQPIHQCVGYSDYALKRFFEKASRQPWFKNTLFVITADHTNQAQHPEYLTSSGSFSVPVIFYQAGSSLKGHAKSIAQQTDIMPTVLGYLGYDKPYLSFGSDLLSTPADKTFAVNYTNGIYQYHKGKYLLQFDGEKSVALYNFITDQLLKKNLLGTVPAEQATMETELKAIIQQYMMRMNGDRLTVE
ncbi:MAG: sulfatase-like hydrolase/transferase [Bacteroides sp.]